MQSPKCPDKPGVLVLQKNLNIFSTWMLMSLLDVSIEYYCLPSIMYSTRVYPYKSQSPLTLGERRGLPWTLMCSNSVGEMQCFSENLHFHPVYKCKTALGFQVSVRKSTIAIYCLNIAKCQQIIWPPSHFKMDSSAFCYYCWMGKWQLCGLTLTKTPQV